MRYKLLISIAMIVIFLGFCFWNYSYQRSYSSNSEAPAQTPHDKVPKFSFKTVDTHAKHDLYDFRGKTIIINFWASWCMPCLYELPMLIELASKHQDNLTLIMLSADDTEQLAYDFARGYCMQRGMIGEDTGKLFPTLPNVFIAWDENRQIALDLFQSTKYPETLVITPDMMLHQEFVGALTEEDLDSLSRTIEPLSIRAVSVNQRGPRR